MTIEQTLSARDRVMRELVARFGPCTLKSHTDYYHELASSIIGQQLSVKAAATIERRFKDLFGGQMPSPQQILEQEIETLRSAGLSRSKALYIQDLAQHIVDGRLNLDALPELNNEEIIRELVAVKGIGEWTAHMFLIFALGRLDVLPTGDLGVRAAIRKLYSFEQLPTPDQCKQVANEHGWHPYESVAVWYLWKSLDNESI